MDKEEERPPLAAQPWTDKSLEGSFSSRVKWELEYSSLLSDGFAYPESHLGECMTEAFESGKVVGATTLDKYLPSTVPGCYSG